MPAEVVAQALRLARKNPRTGQRWSLRAIAAELAKLGHCRPVWNALLPGLCLAHAGGVKGATLASIAGQGA